MVISYDVHIHGKTKRVRKEFQSQEEGRKFWNGIPICHLPQFSNFGILRERWGCDPTDLGHDLERFTLEIDGRRYYDET